jgi:hypothetical protein
MQPLGNPPQRSKIRVVDNFRLAWCFRLSRFVTTISDHAASALPLVRHCTSAIASSARLHRRQRSVYVGQQQGGGIRNFSMLSHVAILYDFA